MFVQRPDIVCVTEIWLNDNEHELLVISGYKLLNYFCRSNVKGGGVCLYIRRDLTFLSKEIKYNS